MFRHEVTAGADDQEVVIQRLTRAASDICPPHLQDTAWIAHCVRSSVEPLWSSPIKTYVPLLAWRQVRCCIRACSCDCGEC